MGRRGGGGGGGGGGGVGGSGGGGGGAGETKLQISPKIDRNWQTERLFHFRCGTIL